LSSLPDAFAQLTNIRALDLSNNQLSNLPDVLAELTGLKELDFSNNRLSSLPNEMARLTRLNRLVLKNNPLPIPPEIIRKGWGSELWMDGNPKAVLDYYFQIQPSTDSRQLNEVKVLLVGEGDVGKTSLMKRLIYGYFDPNEQKTEGINIKNWSLSVQNQEVRLNLWDFGGQEIMHATHQFFLTKRSIYLLVLDNRQSEYQNRLEYWLKVIQTFGDNSPIIIVGNCLDEHKFDIDERGLRKKYKAIKHFIGTSCRTERGLDTLKKLLTQEIATLTHVSDRLPSTWFRLKTQLEEMQKSYDFISYERYQTLCIESGIYKASDQKNLVQFLHDLGIVLNFQDDPRVRDTNVLNPTWVTTGVYKILNNNALLTQHRGILDRSQLQRILNDPHRYPEEKYGFLLNLMRKFELCFDLEGAIDSRFLIPALLPKEEPETGDWSDAMRFDYHYRVLPSSIISRFIVRTNQMISRDTRWRTGVVLKQEHNNRISTRALIRADEEDRKIIIHIKGPQPRILLEIIRSNFKYIHETINIEVEERLGLPDHDKITVAYLHLCNLEVLGQTEFIPEGTRKKYNVRNLLDGIEDAAIRKTDSNERKLTQISSRRSEHSNLFNSSLIILLVLFIITIIFAVLAHAIPGFNLFIVIGAILTAFGSTMFFVLRVAGIIDNTTLSSGLLGFWNTLSSLLGKQSQSNESQSNEPDGSSNSQP
jgi:internalin A